MNQSHSTMQGVARELFERRWRFLFLFLSVFFVSFLVLSLIGFVPEYEHAQAEGVEEVHESVEESLSQVPQVPLHISVPSVGIDVNIENPESRDIAVLDSALNNGAVHYPGTGTLTEDANIFIFGHSSFLPNIINKNYQAFNGLKKLEGDEEIFVDSVDTRYVYRVSSITLAEAEEITVDLRRGTRKLTLSTCNSFGAEGERYIVEAFFVETRAL